MPSKLKKAIGAVKDNTSIGLAKVGSSTSVSDLEVAVVKATRHVEYPADEKHIREILSLTSYSRAYVGACVSIIARRLNKTRNWTVALKTLMLIHRLLSEGDPSYEPEIFFATRRGTRLLNLSDFRDNSQSNSWDFSAFVRTYALYLDEKLEFRMQGRRGKRSAFAAEEEEDLRDHRQHHSPGRGRENNHHHHDKQVAVRATPVREMKIDQLFSRAHHLQQLLERVLACRPTGAAKVNKLVIVALYPIVKESFQVYYEITEIMSIMIDQFMQMQVPDCAKVHDIFSRISKQFEELDGFYGWCKTVGIARSSEYPEVEKISQKKLDVMDEFIRDKSAMGRRAEVEEDHEEEELVVEETMQPEKEADEEEDMNNMKALPPPEDFQEEKEEVKEEEKVDESKSLTVVQEEGDLLNLGADAPTTEQHADSLALALFDGLPKTNPAASSAPAWQAFATDENWEEALVQSASHLSNQSVSLAGGFDMLLLDGMYQQQAIKAATTGARATGSASSVAIGSAGKPAMLALPAPPTTSGSGAQAQQPAYVDPFAASLAVPPPAYVQMSEMEKKQKLLMEEQLMWQQYGRDQMQGHLAYHNVQQAAHQNTYNTGNYQQRF